MPRPPRNTKSAFMKFALRKTIDFAIVNCAAMITASEQEVASARICLNAVYVKPYRAVRAEQAMIGETLNEASAEAAGTAAVSDARPLAQNRYIVQIAKTMVKRAILTCQ